MGLFSVSEILIAIENRTQNVVPPNARKANMGFKAIKEATVIIIKQPLNALRSITIGFTMRISPAVGAATSNVIAYGLAKLSSKHLDKFGTGIPDGVITSEAANNATIAGALVPLLSLGIPGNSVTAVMIGGFMIYGLFSGPRLFRDNPEAVYTVFAAHLVEILCFNSS